MWGEMIWGEVIWGEMNAHHVIPVGYTKASFDYITCNENIKRHYFYIDSQ